MLLTESPEVLTVREAAQVLRLSIGSTYRAIHRGELPVRKLGGRILVPRDALERFLSGGFPSSRETDREPAQASKLSDVEQGIERFEPGV